LHTSILLLLLVGFLRVLICGNRKQLLEHSSMFVIWLLVFHPGHHSCFLLVGANEVFSDVLACFAFECRPEFLGEEFLVCRKLVFGGVFQHGKRTEWTTRELRNLIDLRLQSLRVCLNTGEGVEVSLGIGAVLTIELILAKGLCWCGRVTLRGLGIKRPSVDLGLQTLIVADFSLLFVGEGRRSLEVWMRLGESEICNT
jgi:hypothetical protein